MTRSRVGTVRSTAVLIALCVTLPLAQDRESVGPPDARVLLAAGLYEQAEVTARYHVDALRAAHGEDDLQVASASDVLVRALVLNGRSASEQTLVLARRTLRIKETRLGVEHADLVPSLLNLGDVLVAAFEFAPAIAVIERAHWLRPHGWPDPTASTWPKHSITWGTRWPTPAVTMKPRNLSSGASG